MSRGEKSSCHRRGEVITTVIVWLLLGAIVNVAVAWGAALWSVTKSPLTAREWKLHLKPRDIDQAWWDQHAVTRFSNPLLVADHERGWGLDIRLLCGANPEHVVVERYEPIAISMEGWNVLRGTDMHPERADRVTIQNSGWPTPSMAAFRWDSQIPIGHARFLEEFEIESLGQFAVDRPLTEYSFAVPFWRSTQARMIPLRPMWPGFAINTLFYAGILWLLFTAPFALRRRRRMKRGLCPACAYPVGDSEVCTECGNPVTPPL